MQDPKVSTVVFRFPNPIDVTDPLHHVGLLFVTSRIVLQWLSELDIRWFCKKCKRIFVLTWLMKVTPDSSTSTSFSYVWSVLFILICEQHIHDRCGAPFYSPHLRKVGLLATSSKLPSYAYTIMQTFVLSLCLLSPSYPIPTLALFTLTFPTVLMLSCRYSWMLRIDLQ